MDIKPLVSVLMTAYNRERYIREAIESVLSSTYANFELIIVDDGSSDNTLDIANDYGKKDNRIRVYANERNLGDYPNRNKAASYARGKYLKYVDSDDMIVPETIEIMVDGMERHPEAAIGLASRERFDVKTDYVMLHPLETYRDHFYRTGLLSVSPTFSIIRTDVFVKEHGFWELRNVSDNEFWLRIAGKSPILKFSEGLIVWREHDQQEFRLAPEAYLENNFKILSDKLRDPRCPLTRKEATLILEKEKRSISRELIKHMLKSLNPVKTYKFCKKQDIRFKDLISGLIS